MDVSDFGKINKNSFLAKSSGNLAESSYLISLYIICSILLSQYTDYDVIIANNLIKGN
jgi:hypothetical protein